MKLVDLYEYIEKKMREDGKSSTVFEAAMAEYYANDKEKVKAIADCVNPKYLPEGFREHPVVDSGDIKYVLICFDLYDCRFMFVRTYDQWYQANKEMSRQYGLVKSDSGEGDLKRNSADYYDDGRDVNLLWQIYPTNSRIKSPAFDKVFAENKAKV